MTRTGEALLAAVTADPHDDLPRLAFADLCEEHGDDARAGFIRLQVELARLGDPGPPACGGHTCGASWDGEVRHYDCRGERLRRREREMLLATRPGQWSGFPEALWGAALWQFRRGFVAEVTLPCDAWVAYGPALVRAAPLERVTLADREPVRPTWAGDGPPRWWWVRDGGLDRGLRHAVPAVLFRDLVRLRRWCRRAGTGLEFAGQEAALGALSEAALAWAGAAGR